MGKTIRLPGFAGNYYSKQQGILEREVAVLLENAHSVKVPGKIYGIVAPCDKQLISGGVAARAYCQLVNQDFEYVVILSPAHHTYFEEISVYSGDAYSTPLGDVAIAKEIVAELVGSDKKIISSTLGHDKDEHGIEVQLPYLQQVLYDFQLIPIVMGNQDAANIKIITDVLSKVLKGKNVVIVASSNLSLNHTYDQASLIDKSAINHIKNFDVKTLLKEYHANNIELTGGGPVAATMDTCKQLGATKSNVLLYRNSGDMGGSRIKVSGYFSAIFHS